MSAENSQAPKKSSSWGKWIFYGSLVVVVIAIIVLGGGPGDDDQIPKKVRIIDEL